jgi:molecular chaperone DnaK
VYQPLVNVHVFQGERPLAADNKSLAHFQLVGIPPAPRGMPQIEVTFDIDANGILSVKAHDKGTGREQKITITASSGLSKDEVERMRREAEKHAAEDTRKREEVETRNMADTMVYTAERTLREHGDKIPSNVRSEVDSKIAAVKSALTGGDVQQHALHALHRAPAVAPVAAAGEHHEVVGPLVVAPSVPVAHKTPPLVVSIPGIPWTTLSGDGLALSSLSCGISFWFSLAERNVSSTQLTNS